MNKHSANIDLAAREIMELFPNIDQYLIKPSQLMFKAQVSPFQFHLLRSLEQKSPQNMTELARKSRVAKQQLTLMVDKLIGSGFIDRQHDAHDRRVINISLTRNGRTFLRQQMRGLLLKLTASLQAFSEPEIAKLQQSAKTINEIVRRINL